MGTCYSCGTPLDIDRVYRTTECPACRAAVKVCLNCRFYDPGAHWECKETISEPVREKDRANFCEYFELSRVHGETSALRSTSARDKLEKLFGPE